MRPFLFFLPFTFLLQRITEMFTMCTVNTIKHNFKGCKQNHDTRLHLFLKLLELLCQYVVVPNLSLIISVVHLSRYVLLNGIYFTSHMSVYPRIHLFGKCFLKFRIFSLDLHLWPTGGVWWCLISSPGYIPVSPCCSWSVRPAALCMFYQG